MSLSHLMLSTCLAAFGLLVFFFSARLLELGSLHVLPVVVLLFHLPSPLNCSCLSVCVSFTHSCLFSWWTSAPHSSSDSCSPSFDHGQIVSAVLSWFSWFRVLQCSSSLPRSMLNFPFSPMISSLSFCFCAWPVARMLFEALVFRWHPPGDR